MELKRLLERGELVDVNGYRAGVVDRLIEARSALMSLPGRIAPRAPYLSEPTLLALLEEEVAAIVAGLMANLDPPPLPPVVPSPPGARGSPSTAGSPPPSGSMASGGRRWAMTAPPMRATATAP